MRDWLELQTKLVPDLMNVLQKRYAILRQMQHAGLVGRRTLASSLDMTERVLRAEVDFLKEQGLVETVSHGMTVSEAGRALLLEMEPLMNELFGLHELAERIRSRFNMNRVIVVPGDSDQSGHAKKELGRAGAAALKQFAHPGDVIAVAGGSTMAETAGWLSPSPQYADILFVPARGGLGETVELQANTIASSMAKKTGGSYRLLHVPDDLGEEAYQSLLQEPNIQEIVEVIRRARIVVHGIGEAEEMANRRKTNPDTIETLKRSGALAEAFGYYFDKEGRVVHNVQTIGLRMEDIFNTEVVIGIAGGKSKGRAIAAVLQFGHEDVLVTDEAAAMELLDVIPPSQTD